MIHFACKRFQIGHLQQYFHIIYGKVTSKMITDTHSIPRVELTGNKIFGLLVDTNMRGLEFVGQIMRYNYQLTSIH